MPQLIEAGLRLHRKPPLYRVKNGKQEIYIEKESELEELLLARQARAVRDHERLDGKQRT